MGWAPTITSLAQSLQIFRPAIAQWDESYRSQSYYIRDAHLYHLSLTHQVSRLEMADR
ncbi:hypothetical protein BDV36DRAFT_244632 [Aspergillus pseudocaelatus]|uniref:Transcription factor domain-containing protein n=1 Tax=Aspergillus pseudocaelatus TaxID=1825620 RepID=A0ABQ6X0E9_9EURO|nr:hypothetical protein BDV36DRAFT_244632 [Aspergillus pseudocaelatus]